MEKERKYCEKGRTRNLDLFSYSYQVVNCERHRSLFAYGTRGSHSLPTAFRPFYAILFLRRENSPPGHKVYTRNDWHSNNPEAKCELSIAFTVDCVLFLQLFLRCLRYAQCSPTSEAKKNYTNIRHFPPFFIPDDVHLLLFHANVCLVFPCPPFPTRRIRCVKNRA